jgi:Holliday junction DNA helicase RuvB subunit
VEQSSFATFIGQESIKRELAMRITAAKMRRDALDHFLLCGADQMGKATLARTIAYEMEVSIRITAGPSIERAGDLAAILTHLKQDDILFIDEVHRLGRAVEEVLYPAMEDFVLDIVVGKGYAAKNVRLNLPRFTVIGTSSRPSQIEQHSLIRYVRYDFAPYTVAEMGQLVSKFMMQYKQVIQPDAAELIAYYCEGTPGKAKVLVKRVADFCLVRAPSSSVDQNLAWAALSFLGYARKTENPSDLAQKLNGMDGIEFEDFIAQFFRNNGYAVEATKATGDHGIDLFARKGQRHVAVQCKRWTKPVGEPVIRDFYGAFLSSGAKFGCIIATSGFTTQASDFAQGKPIKLIDLDTLIQLVLGQVNVRKSLGE